MRCLRFIHQVFDKYNYLVLRIAVSLWLFNKNYMIMRKTILVFLSFFVELCFGQISAQGRDWDMSSYLPIVREGVKWVNENQDKLLLYLWN